MNTDLQNVISIKIYFLVVLAVWNYTLINSCIVYLFIPQNLFACPFSYQSTMKYFLLCPHFLMRLSFHFNISCRKRTIYYQLIIIIYHFMIIMLFSKVCFKKVLEFNSLQEQLQLKPHQFLCPILEYSEQVVTAHIVLYL